jgi:predicted Zn-dependent peptidase
VTDHQLSILPSGVRVVTEAMPAVRSVALGLWIGVGSRDETAHQLGASHFLEHTLFKGTRRRSARDIAESLDAVGGEMNAFTSKEVTCFYARVLDRDVPLAFDVLADMVVDAANTPADVEAERQVVLSEIDIHLDTPDDLVHSDLSEIVLGDHPLARETLGDERSISGMHRDTIHDHYLATYRPGNLTVAAAGAVDHDTVVALADQLLGDLGRPGGAPPARTAPSGYGAGALRIRHRPTEQAHLALGMPGVDQLDPDRWALRVLNVALGGGMSSRLFQELREVRGLCYSTYSYASSYLDAGLEGAYVGTAPGKVDETLAVLRDELRRVADDVDADEVERAKGALRGGTVLGLEETGSRMSRIGKQVATDVPIVTVDEALALIDAVTVDDVMRVAHRVFDAPWNLAVVGPFAEDETDRFAAVLG